MVTSLFGVSDPFSLPRDGDPCVIGLVPWERETGFEPGVGGREREL